jgi:hypothetical protein
MIEKKLQSFYESMQKWVSSGFNETNKDTLQKRLSACGVCEFWDKSSFGGTGKCKKCGCSTWAKLRMATEKCPIGKWDAIKLH